MKKEITAGQLISVAVGVIMSILAAWISTKERIAVIETENKRLDARIVGVEIEMKAERAELRNEVRHLQNTVNDIKVMLERKQDRK